MKNGFKKAMLTMGVAVMLMGIGAVGANAATVEVGDFTIDRSYAYGSYTTKRQSVQRPRRRHRSADRTAGIFRHDLSDYRSRKRL